VVIKERNHDDDDDRELRIMLHNLELR